jgi:hypothetical protein
MTEDIPDNWNNYSARYWADGKPKRRNIAARRADWVRIDKRNSKEALRKAIYDTPPDDTPYMSSILPK